MGRQRVKRVDWLFYGCGMALSLGIVLGNYYDVSSQTPAAPKESVHQSLEKIINRMDSVSTQLSAWGAIDVRHDAPY